MSTVIGIRDERRVVLAADSKAIDVFDEQKNLPAALKIGYVDALFFAAAGLDWPSVAGLAAQARASSNEFGCIGRVRYGLIQRICRTAHYNELYRIRR